MGGGTERDEHGRRRGVDIRTLFGGGQFTRKPAPSNPRTPLDKMKPSEWATEPQATGLDVAQTYGAGLRNSLLPSFIGPPSPQQPQVTRAMAGLAEEEEVPPAGLPVRG